MFQCSKCGLCCRNLDKSELYDDLNRGDGVCIYLKDNLCSIYNERPILCRVDDCYEIYFKNQYTLKEYYEINEKICKELQNQK